MSQVKQHLSIEGMTCKGCEASVSKSLNNISGVEHAEVSLEKKEATLAANKLIPIKDIEQVLGPKYTVIALPAKHTTNTETKPEAETSKWKALKPLFLILLFISVASILLHLDSGDMQAMMYDFMGLFLIVFSFFKLLDIKGFASSFAMYDPLAKQIATYGRVYPFLELALGMAFLYRFQLVLTIGITLALLSLTTIGVIHVLRKKEAIRCACLGTALNLPMTEATLIENLIMIFMGIGLLLQIFF